MGLGDIIKSEGDKRIGKSEDKTFSTPPSLKKEIVLRVQLNTRIRSDQSQKIKDFCHKNNWKAQDVIEKLIDEASWLDA